MKLYKIKIIIKKKLQKIRKTRKTRKTVPSKRCMISCTSCDTLYSYVYGTHKVNCPGCKKVDYAENNDNLHNILCRQCNNHYYISNRVNEKYNKDNNMTFCSYGC